MPRQHLAFTSCIVVPDRRTDPASLLRVALPLLAPSASFAVASPYSQPLADAAQALRSQGLAAGVSLQEAWWREHQVLPGRTHPTMSMDHGGGFILSGTAVVARPAAGATAAAPEESAAPEGAAAAGSSGAKRQRVA